MVPKNRDYLILLRLKDEFNRDKFKINTSQQA